ncbi:BRAP2 RING ZnF UBP domain-containing protein 2-like [Rhodamnia argentea]|uniref:BRAP2 RING ZnF UBP domain-containing protein 2-like n=1 Tax=Rhodamnia argentea TaxID=178133 RepID=A0A8B8P1A5_9MYRT|nr:BRAP2 RING ZnF UBP domain-containing protein 2-like [Rhodamnia argentea]
MSSSTTSAAAGTSQEESFPPPSVPVPAGDPASTSSSLRGGGGGMTQAFCFSSGNPRIEETRGVMHLFSDDAVSSSSPDLPVGRKPLVCVFGVPDHMTYADFCQFCASFIHHILEMRIVRTDGMEDRYSILIRMDGQDATDNFYRYFNGRRFNSLEVEVCRILYTVDVQYTGYKGSAEHPHTSPMATSEQPSCPVCLERLDQDTSGILTTICNHSFHISCISKCSDSSCPVCRYCQQQPEKSICFVCQTSENLWMCVICGFVGCGRYKAGHATVHWKETQHCYSLELETQRVWDYAGDNYVHRLIQSKTDGKLVELNSHCMHSSDGCESCNCANSGLNEALLNSKVDVIIKEYNDLLATQLENQKLYYETLLQEFEEETEREISEAVEMALTANSKVQKKQTKLDECVRETKFLDELNENLMANQEIWKAKLSEAEERERNALRAKDDKMQQLEEELKDLMACLEEGNSN